MNTKVAIFTKEQKIFDGLSAFPSEFTFVLNSEFDGFEEGFVLCDTSTFLSLQEKISKVQKDHLYVISHLSDEENMLLIERYGLFHLVGLNDETFAQETLNQMHKTYRKKIWGLSPYMNDSSTVKVISLSDSKYVNEMMTEALTHFDFKDYFSSPIEYIQVMANELISNSLYKGPNRKRSEQGLSSVDRKSPVILKGAELVQVTLGMDDKGVALSVQDSFGGLSYSTLIESLRRSFAEKTVMEKKDGAGLGLYLTFLHSNQFIINYRENFRTEVICIIDKNKRYKNYKQRIRSFHFFQEVPGEKIKLK
jgi:sigma-B regulation protein RsbU (phosphoserine phosphatase)